MRELILVHDDYKEPTICKGMKFRGYTSTFWSGHKLETRHGIRFLKRDSCTGCSKCAHFDEFMEETPENIIGLNEIKHGKIYTLNVTNMYYDWQSGYLDDWDVEIVEVRE